SLKPGNQAVGKTVSTLKLPKGVLVLFVSREENNIIPDGSHVFQGGDKVFLLSTKEIISKIEKHFGNLE
ncbi:MAG: hypothetical protein JW760_09760, partial [Spirochaetales bacterium]|nr:hypothetical protein [Spirochaetales bacterium]